MLQCWNAGFAIGCERVRPRADLVQRGGLGDGGGGLHAHALRLGGGAARGMESAINVGLRRKPAPNKQVGGLELRATATRLRLKGLRLCVEWTWCLDYGVDACLPIPWASSEAS